MTPKKTARKRAARPRKPSSRGKTQVYAGGKIRDAEPGQTAGFYIGAQTNADLVVANGKELKKVTPNYVLVKGDRLIVTPRGVSG